MKIEVNVQRRYFLTVLAVVLVLAGAIAVYAYGTSAPSSFGHTLGELSVSGVTGCTQGTLLKVGANGVVVCEAATSGGSIVNSGFTNFQVFTTTGITDTWSVPSGVTKVMIEVWGAGGSGMFCNTNGGGASSGGGGGYGRGVFGVGSGSSLTIEVGEGGRTGTTSEVGGVSSVVGTGFSISATGGGGSSESYKGGGAFSSITGKDNFLSIAGRNGYFDVSGGVLSIGGNAGSGGSGGIRTSSAQDVVNVRPTAPGGGGACGQDGALGRVVIWW